MTLRLIEGDSIDSAAAEEKGDKRKKRARGKRRGGKGKKGSATAFSYAPPKEFEPPSVFPTTAELLTLPTSNVPRILLTPSALFKCFVLTAKDVKEVGWLGFVRELPDNVFLVEDIVLLEQEVHGSTTEIGIKGLEPFAEWLLSQPDGMELWNRVRFWGHSHGNMGVWGSVQDNDTVLEFGQGGSDFFLRGIFNRRGEINFSLYDWRRNLVFHNVPWEPAEGQLSDEEKLQLKTELETEFEQKVTVMPFQVSTSFSNGDQIEDRLIAAWRSLVGESHDEDDGLLFVDGGGYPVVTSVVHSGHNDDNGPGDEPETGEE